MSEITPSKLGYAPREFEVLNSALYWYANLARASREKTIALNAKMPRTYFVAYNHPLAVSQVENESEEKYDFNVEEVRRVARKIGYPVFVRTDLGSAKHAGPDAYKPIPNRMKRVLARLVEDQEMKYWIAPVSPRAFMIREWLDLEYDFVAFNGHRIANEWRVFVRDDKVLCTHFYWPEVAIEFHFDQEPVNWRERLRDLSLRLSTPELESIERDAIQAARVNNRHDQWSVDFARDVDAKTWWLIDMAIAERSWHPETCERHADVRRGGFK